MSKIKDNGAGDAGGATISFRVNAAELDALTRAAAEQKLSVHKLAQRIVLDAIDEMQADSKQAPLPFRLHAAPPSGSPAATDTPTTAVPPEGGPTIADVVRELHALRHGVTRGFQAVLLNVTTMERDAVLQWARRNVLEADADHR